MYLAANRKEASDEAVHCFRAREVTRGREWESDMTAAPRLEGHLKKGRCCLEGEERPTLGPKDGRGAGKAPRSISISLAAHIQIS